MSPNHPHYPPLKRTTTPVQAGPSSGFARLQCLRGAAAAALAAVVALALGSGGAGSTARADEPEAPAVEGFRPMEDQPLEIGLVAERARVRPGETFRVGIDIVPEEGFHTYWKAPGIVGIPTAIDWELPEGWVAGEIEWPAPEVVMMGPYPAHGYHGPVLLPIAITVPDDALQGLVTLAGDARWMCCAATCHPGFRRLELSVEVVADVGEEAADGGGSADDALTERFAEARAARPQPARGFEFTAERDAATVTIVIRGTGEEGIDATPVADLDGLRFFCDSNLIRSDEPQVAELQEDGSLRLKLVASAFGPEDADQLGGVFEAPGGWYLDQREQPVRHIEVRMPLPPPSPL